MESAGLGIDYIEFPVVDMDAAKAFYTAAFGWRFNDYGPGYCGFVDGTRGDRESGGFRVEASVSAGGPLVVLLAKDIEADLARVRESGGTITKEIFEFPGGRRFEFTDPSGNALAVWSEG